MWAEITLVRGIASEINYQLILAVLKTLEAGRKKAQALLEKKEKATEAKISTHTQPMRSVFNTWFEDNFKRVLAGKYQGPLTTYDVANMAPQEGKAQPASFHPGKAEAKNRNKKRR